MSYGTIVYEEDGLVIPIEYITLRDGRIIFGGTYTATKNATVNFGGWTCVYGKDESVIQPRVELDTIPVKVKRHERIPVTQPLMVTSTEAAHHA